MTEISQFEKEVKAMRTINTALEKLDTDARLRVLKYVNERESDLVREETAGYALTPRIVSPMSERTIEAGKAVFETDIGTGTPVYQGHHTTCKGSGE